jgi:hypothetical protein
MGLACNIDAAGKRARLLGGIVAVVLGLIVSAISWFAAIGWLWIVAAALLAAGAFAIFEARAGWCAMRAMGFKTKI